MDDAPPFETLLREHSNRLFTLALRMAGRRELAEEILQEALLTAFTHYDRFRGDSAPFTWLYRILINTGRKAWRESKRLPVALAAEEHGISQVEVYEHINRSGPCEEEALVNQTRETCLQVFMNCMPSRYRAVFTLRQILHFDVRQTAEILKVTENTVKVNLHRARRIMAEHLKGRCSLVHKGAMCECRLYAGHIDHVGKRDKLLDIEVIRRKEDAACSEFHEELGEILQIDDLYDGLIKAPDEKTLMERVKALRERNDIKILRYE